MTKQTADGIQGAVFLVGLYEGVLPFPSKLFDWQPFLAFPVRLDAPAWWIVSGLVIAVALAVMAVINRAVDA